MATAHGTQQHGTATVVTEKDARKVAEAARETAWTRPSFAKELYLGHFRPDLIAPHPRTAPDIAARGESYLEALRGVLATVDGRAIARVGDKCACGGVILEGKSGAVLDGRPVAYLGSKTSCGGVIVECAGTATFV